jgi:hypothetical protein
MSLAKTSGKIYNRTTTARGSGAKPRKIIPVIDTDGVMRMGITSQLSPAAKDERPPTPEEILSASQCALGACLVSISNCKDVEKLSTIISRVVRAATDIIRAHRQIESSLTDEDVMAMYPQEVLDAVQSSVAKALKS